MCNGLLPFILLLLLHRNSVPTALVASPAPSSALLRMCYAEGRYPEYQASCERRVCTLDGASRVKRKNVSSKILEFTLGRDRFSGVVR